MRVATSMFRRVWIGLVAGLCVAGNAKAEPPPGYEVQPIDVQGARAATIDAYVLRPSGSGPWPAVVGLHGCGGLFNKNGQFSKRELDWGKRWAAAGYVVVFPDSFNPRGFRQICTVDGATRPIRPRHRGRDAAATLEWLSLQPFIDRNRLAIVGWSNGGSSVLELVGRPDDMRVPVAPKVAIAFYPGCRPSTDRDAFAGRAPLTILMGSADDWTPADRCRALVAKFPAVRLIEYPGAVHGFDAPDSPRRTRSGVGLSARGDGKVEVGTDPVARAAAIAEVETLLKAAFEPGGRK